MKVDPDLESYIADNYGSCSVMPCACLKTGWRGRMCANWTPVAARDLDELRTLTMPPRCDGCGVNLADPPSRLCPGCQAYREHQA